MPQYDISRFLSLTLHTLWRAAELALQRMGENRWKSDNSEIFVLNRDLNERKEAILI